MDFSHSRYAMGEIYESLFHCLYDLALLAVG